MDMPSYLEQIRHAVSGVLPLIWEERLRLVELRGRLERLTAAVQREYETAEWIAINAEDADDVAVATGRHWETYFGPDKERHEVGHYVESLEEAVGVNEFSVQALAGAMLQYAKQGLSIVHGGLNRAPTGRAIGSQGLKDLVWRGRNQALHWEEGRPHPSVVACFDALIADIGAQFTHYRTRNLAFEVIELLGWRKWEDFEADMLTLA